jgi:hypothetical protein
MSSHRMLLMLLVAVFVYMVIFKRSEKLSGQGVLPTSTIYTRKVKASIPIRGSQGRRCEAGFEFSGTHHNQFMCYKKCARDEVIGNAYGTTCAKCPTTNPVGSGRWCYTS